MYKNFTRDCANPTLIPEHPALAQAQKALEHYIFENLDNSTSSQTYIEKVQAFAASLCNTLRNEGLSPLISAFKYITENRIEHFLQERALTHTTHSYRPSTNAPLYQH